MLVVLLLLCFLFHVNGSHLNAKVFSTSRLACLARYIISTWNRIAGFLHSYLILSQKIKQVTVPTFIWLFRDDATTAKGLGCDKGRNLRLPNFAVVPLMPTCGIFVEGN